MRIFVSSRQVKMTKSGGGRAVRTRDASDALVAFSDCLSRDPGHLDPTVLCMYTYWQVHSTLILSSNSSLSSKLHQDSISFST